MLAVASLLIVPAHAHIGSPDTFVQATAGPYKFLLAAHPPAVYPGALELNLRFNPDDHITTATASLDGAQPIPIQIFDAGTATTTLWLPTPAAHTIHITVQGSAFDLMLPPVAPTQALSKFNQGWLSLLLFLGLTLAAGAVVLLARKRQYPGYAVLMVLVGCTLAAVAMHLSRATPPTTTITANLTPNNSLDITLTNPAENFANLVPDDGKLMHLFLIRQPQQDVFLHLHPHQLAPGYFTVALPAMPSGTYRLFADFYLAPTGSLKDARAETDTITLDLPANFHPASADPDNTIAVLPPANAGAAASSPMSGVETSSDGTTRTAHLLDGYTLTLATPSAVHPQHANLFQVTLLDPTGQPPVDMALYLNMPAHAVVVRSDNSVFAHIHPGGTLPMLGTPSSTAASSMAMSMPMNTAMPAPSNTATIPYGFPSAGRYRVFVQMKHGPIVETAAFDLNVN